MKDVQELSKNYMKIDAAAERWEVTPRRVQALCAAGRINGAVRFGRDWMIPKDAVRPVDGRTKEGKKPELLNQPLPRKTPFLYMSDLYSVPGSADEAVEALSDNREAQVLFEAEVSYSRGNIDRVYNSANYLLHKHSGFYAIISAGMLLALCAIWRGDLVMWRQAKQHIAEAPAKDDNDRDIMALAITAVDSMLYDVSNFPEWFKMGNFEPLHKDALPAAKVYYAKYLYAAAYAVATKQMGVEGVQGLSLMAMVPFTLEPMISQAKADNSIISEIYLRMTCATVYRLSGNEENAVRHLDRAIALAIPDRLFGLLAEYWRVLDTLLESRLSAVDVEVCQAVKALSRIYNAGWSKLGSVVLGRQIATTLTQKERDVAKLAAFGMSNAQIAEKLHMSLSVVKQAIRTTSEKSGMSRDEFAYIL
ncbi:MAG: hypothetical protein E7641_01520 [Ruminococcaceae bacterium]|nr:hypothetical protein [Oscillospiraceae bacterium]